jgi:hypothetical protein
MDSSILREARNNNDEPPRGSAIVAEVMGMPGFGTLFALAGPSPR